MLTPDAFPFQVFFHTGTIPSKKGQSYCADLRMMVCNRAGKGFVPVAMYARKARVPLANISSENSWNVLGTNLSVKNGTLLVVVWSRWCCGDAQGGKGGLRKWARWMAITG